MRSKSTIYIAIAFSLFLVLSIGYALFSENIRISGTAKAEGTFDVDIVECLSTFTQEQEDLYNLQIADKGATSASCVIAQDQNSVTLTTGFNVPSGFKNYGIKIKNNGTINAVYTATSILISQKICIDGLNSSTATFDSTLLDGSISDPGECLSSVINPATDEVITDTSGFGAAYAQNFGNYGIITEALYDSNGNDISSDTSRFIYENGEPVAFNLLPGDEIIVRIEAVSEKAFNNANQAKNVLLQSFSSTITFNFTQPTAQ